MSFANDKLYDGYLRHNMGTILTRVKVREIMIHLPCLTAHDRENIEAKRETYGNYDSMALLLDCLKRRENWAEQFINALEVCEHRILAAEMRAEYNTLRGLNNSSPSSLPTTVVRAHVHPAPPASPLSVPESGANSQAAAAAAAAPPAEASAPPKPAARAPPSLEAPVQPQVPEAVSAPEPVPEPPQSTQVEVAARPSTPPASPESPHPQASTTPPPQREITSQQEPEENSESDIQDISGGNGAIPDQEIVADPQPAPCGTDTPPRRGPLQTTTTPTGARPPQRPSPTQMNSDVTDGSSCFMMTPEKPPVQDTTPHVDRKPAVVLQPAETSEPPATQVVESSPRTDTAATTSPLPNAAGIDASLSDDADMCLSKPSPLVSIHPPNNGSPAVPAPRSPSSPYSGDSGRLEVSDAVTRAHPPACSAVSSTTVTTASALPCQENGISLNHNEPEENHYESPSRSLDMGQVLTHVVHVSGEPSILDLDGQSLNQPPCFNGEAARESVSIPSSEERRPSEPAPADSSPGLKTLQDSEKEAASCIPPANTKYVVAAGVGACALLLAWRFKS